jgi:WD40 repeat protein
MSAVSSMTASLQPVDMNPEPIFHHVAAKSPYMSTLTKIFERILKPLYGSQDKALSQIAEGKDRKCFLLYESENPSGVIVFKTDPSNEFEAVGIKNSIEIKSLFVVDSSNNSGRGLGTTLLGKIVEEAGPDKTHCESFHVTVSETKKESLIFFLTRGFVIRDIWKGKYQEGKSEYLMACSAQDLLLSKGRQTASKVDSLAKNLSQIAVSSHSSASQGCEPPLGQALSSKVLATVSNAHWDDIHGLKLLSDGTFISGSKDNTIRKWTLEGELKRIIQDVEPMGVDSQDWITAMGVLNDEYWISGERNGKVRLWNTAGEFIKYLPLKLPKQDHVSHKHNMRRVNCLVPGLNKSKPSFFTGFPTMFDEYNLIEARTATQAKVHNNDWVYCIHPLDENRNLVVIAGTLEIWKRSKEHWTREDTIVREPPKGRNTRAHISVLTPLHSSTNQFALGVFGGQVAIADLEQKKIVQEWREHRDNIWAVENMDRNLLASSGDDGTIKLWDPRQAQSIRTITHDKRRVTALLCPKENLLVAGGSCHQNNFSNNGGATLYFYDIRK